MGKNFNIKNLYSNLEETFEVFSCFILEHNYQKPNYQKDYPTISWPNYQSGITKNIVYAKEYEEIKSSRQFSFLLMDESIVQIYYQFDRDTLIKYKLAFYPFPVLTRENFSQIIEDYYCESYDETLCDLYQDLLELSPKITNTSHLRFDYDHAVISHAQSELQIGAINNIRIPSSVLIYPFVFVDFIVKNQFRKDQKYQEIIQSEKYKQVYNFSKSRSVGVEKFQETNIYLTLVI